MLVPNTLEDTMSITPSIGRIVWFKSNHRADFLEADEAPAIITRVWSDTCVSLTVFRDGNTPITVSSVALVDDDKALIEGGRSWRWMPYQKQLADGTIQPGQPAVEAAPAAAEGTGTENAGGAAAAGAEGGKAVG